MREDVPGCGRRTGADSVAPRARVRSNDGTVSRDKTGLGTRAERRYQAEDRGVAFRPGHALRMPRALASARIDTPIRSRPQVRTAVCLDSIAYRGAHLPCALKYFGVTSLFGGPCPPPQKVAREDPKSRGS